MDEKYPELEDILQAIKKYSVLNPDCTFVYGIIGYKPSEEVCDECGGQCGIEPDDIKSRFGAFGDLGDLRIMLNSLRDMVEEEVDENGFTNV